MATEHVNGNGTEEPMDTTAAVTHSDHFQTLLEAGLPQKVAEKLDEIYVAGKPVQNNQNTFSFRSQILLHVHVFCKPTICSVEWESANLQ